MTDGFEAWVNALPDWVRLVLVLVTLGAAILAALVAWAGAEWMVEHGGPLRILGRGVQWTGGLALAALLLSACVLAVRSDTRLHDFRDDCARDGLRVVEIAGPSGWLAEVHCFDGHRRVRSLVEGP